jgi:hypothetical protein
MPVKAKPIRPAGDRLLETSDEELLARRHPRTVVGERMNGHISRRDHGILILRESRLANRSSGTCLPGLRFADEGVEVIASWAHDATQHGQADRRKIGGAVLWS